MASLLGDREIANSRFWYGISSRNRARFTVCSLRTKLGTHSRGN